MKSLSKNSANLEWMTGAPDNTKNVALLIPQFNESTHTNFERRLEYFKAIADKFRSQLDVILIDDGSTDASLEKMNSFLTLHPGAFTLASVYPNANKVGALYLTALDISHEFVILSDFDTDILGLDKVFLNLDLFKKDFTLMGCYFRMLPYEGSGTIFLFQQLEYSLQRSIYRFHKKERTIRVMPGAGCCYRREVLTSIYRQHSGLRNGEDREATLIGMKLGYKTFYLNSVLALTRPPLSRKSLITQRVRWNKGYLETFYKERKYYFDEIKKFSRIGLVTMVDIVALFFILLMPAIAIASGIAGIYYLGILVVLVYGVQLAWCLKLLSKAPEESLELKKQKTTTVLLYPIVKLYIDYFAWTKATILFAKDLLKPGNKQNDAEQNNTDTPVTRPIRETSIHN